MGNENRNVSIPVFGLLLFFLSNSYDSIIPNDATKMPHFAHRHLSYNCKKGDTQDSEKLERVESRVKDDSFYLFFIFLSSLYLTSLLGLFPFPFIMAMLNVCSPKQQRNRLRMSRLEETEKRGEVFYCFSSSFSIRANLTCCQHLIFCDQAGYFLKGKLQWQAEKKRRGEFFFNFSCSALFKSFLHVTMLRSTLIPP